MPCWQACEPCSYWRVLNHVPSPTFASISTSATFCAWASPVHQWAGRGAGGCHGTGLAIPSGCKWHSPRGEQGSSLEPSSIPSSVLYVCACRTSTIRALAWQTILVRTCKGPKRLSVVIANHSQTFRSAPAWNGGPGDWFRRSTVTLNTGTLRQRWGGESPAANGDCQGGCAVGSQSAFPHRACIACRVSQEIDQHLGRQPPRRGLGRAAFPAPHLTGLSAFPVGLRSRTVVAPLL